jgi:hypothetical protein
MVRRLMSLTQLPPQPLSPTHRQELGILQRDVQPVPRRAPEVALSAILPVAVGGGAFHVQPQAAHLLSTAGILL